MSKIPILYNEKMWVDNGHEISPSSKKPKLFTEYVQKLELPCEVTNIPFLLEREDFYLAHDKSFVDGVFNCSINNGFGNTSPGVNSTLPWTSASMFYACIYANPTTPAISPTSGFHHAAYSSCGGFCTFNGLLISALKLLKEYPHHYSKIAIIDMDAHFGNGSADIIEKLHLQNSIYHNTFGKKFACRYNEPVYTNEESVAYIQEIDNIKKDLQNFKPNLIMYQAGADVHIDDVYGGILTTQHMIERDTKVFTIARDLKIPLAFNLAGGYQVDNNGDITKVLELHVNTVKAAISVYS